MHTFADLKLSQPLLEALQEMGFTSPTPIQAQTLPQLLGPATDFLGMAATGTGKTAAFGIPLVEHIQTEKKATQAIVLCPTRELAQQVANQLTLLGKRKGIEVLAIVGGRGYGEQKHYLREGSYIIVATPGRLIDHLKQKNFSLKDVRTVVLDEADEMISMGFKDELEYLLKHVNRKECRTWLFAATMSLPLRKVADSYLQAPKHAQINKKEMLSGTVKQVYYTVRDMNKANALCKILESAEDFYGLVFCQTKVQVVELTDFLRQKGCKVQCLHGDKTQREREHTMKQFRDKQVTLLVCSDVAARGIDVKDLTHVINYSLPNDLESYVHRIGRTGRSGKGGLAFSLVSPAQQHLIRRIEQMTKSKMELGTLPSRKDLSEKKLSKLLPRFLEAKNRDKATALILESWATELEKMSKVEIAGRFIALNFPELFEEKGEDTHPESRIPREERRHRFMQNQHRPRRFRGSNRGAMGPNRGMPPSFHEGSRA